MLILLAEDDAPLASFIAKAFASQDHATDIAEDGKKALQQFSSRAYDLLILDLNLPVVSGHDVLARIRKQDTQLPILILTATDHLEERVACLDAGADDYLTKPFSFSELSARVRALLRRRSSQVETLLRVQDLELDCVRRTVRRGPRYIELTPKEFSLLEYFMRNPGRQISRKMIIENVWKLDPEAATNVVDVYVNYLRSKIDERAKVKLIRTIRKVGYELGVAAHPAAGRKSSTSQTRHSRAKV